MNKKNFSKALLLFLAGAITGILIFQFATPELENFLLSQLILKQTPLSFENSSVEEETEILCQKQIKGKAIEVDLSIQRMKMCENSKAIKMMSISSGREDSPTPKGNFRIINKSLMIYSKATSCWLPFWLGFTQDGQYGFHELPICEKDGGRTGLDKVGQPASLGCIRLNIEDAETLYKWAEINTPVTIF